ncbi:MAG: PD-(D/E)XK nuclease family protein [Bacteroidetes bacterium]|nr:PD-(D/E)XK nuclease family protein [Bacteroidota bacterium]
MQNSFIHQLVEQLPNKNAFYQNATIIFPTKRACQYFERAVLEAFDGQNLWLPEVISIQEFLYQHSPYVILPENDLIAILYPIHEAHTGLKQSFVDFYKWGQMMLKDFSEIDQYLIDPKYLFHYITSFKTIDEDGELSPEQSELLKQFWDTLPSEENADIKKNFIKTWAALGDIYESFKSQLIKNNHAYEGMAYSALLDELEHQQKQFSKRNFVICGFNALSAFEERLFRHFAEHYETKIFWDADDYYLNHTDLESYLFIRRYKQLFPDKVNHFITTDVRKSLKQIDVVEAPLDIAQIDYAISALETLDTSNTVIVLCDESLLYPLVNQLPENLSFNITMGFPLSLHPIQTLLKTVLDLKTYQNTKRSISAPIFLKVIKHALVQPYFSSKVIKKLEERAVLQGYLSRKNIEEQLGENAELINLVLDDRSDDVASLHHFLEYLNNHGAKSNLDILAIEQTIETIQEVTRSAVNGNINLENEDLSKLMRQALSAKKLPFDNSSLTGLQIMGFLETRNLDFKNLIILGATDNHLPGTSKSSSFIPFTIKKALSLPTYTENDAIYSYHFYRLLQRAENIKLVSANDIQRPTNNRSRFIEQLNYEWQVFPQISIAKTHLEIPLPADSPAEPVSIDKSSPTILASFEDYFNHKRSISASALITYITCPFQFYLKYIAQLEEPEELTEEYDQRTLGLVFHKAMQIFYMPFLTNQKWITPEVLQSYLKQVDLEEMMIQAFEAEKISQHNSSLIGQNVLIKDIILQLMKILIHKEISAGYTFRIRGLEQKIDAVPVALQNGRTVVLKSYIDRVDEVKDEVSGNYIRIIDYKTGDASINNPNSRSGEKPLHGYFEPYFDSSKYKEGFQGYFYAWIYQKKFDTQPVQVGFYSAKKMSAGLVCLRKGSFITNELLLEYERCIMDKLNEIFDVNLPFIHSEDEHAYQYSPYKVLVD